MEGLPAAPIGGQKPFNFTPLGGPAFDLIEILPPAAADKMRQLRQRSLDLHAIIPPYEDIRQASIARGEAANALKRLTDHQQLGGFNLKPDHPSVRQAQRTLDKATATFDELRARQATRSSAWQASSQPVANVETWLRDGRPQGAAVEDIEPPATKLNKGEGLLDAIARLQRRARELKADLHRIASAPFPSAYAKQQMRAEIEQLSQRGAPDPTLLIELDRPVVWPTQRTQSEVHGTTERAIAFGEAVDTVALLAFLLKPTLTAALDKLIDEASDDKSALSHEARQLAEATVLSDLLAVERDEAALTWRAIAEQLPCQFRADISPVALLGVALVTKGNGHLPQTTAGHAFDIVRPGGR
jgi:hypothetical protein